MSFIAEFDIQGLPKSPNGKHGHWRAKYARTLKWKSLVYEQCVMAKIVALRLEKATLTFTRHSSQEMDFDNLSASFKALLDGLTQAGVIIDDKPSVIGCPLYQWKRAKAKDGHVTIRIEAP